MKPTNDAIEYAHLLGRRYKCCPAIENLDGTEDTIGKVAKAVLPPGILGQWLVDEKAESRKLRRMFGKKPYDKFDNETIEDL